MYFILSYRVRRNLQNVIYEHLCPLKLEVKLVSLLVKNVVYQDVWKPAV